MRGEGKKIRRGENVLTIAALFLHSIEYCHWLGNVRDFVEA